MAGVAIAALAGGCKEPAPAGGNAATATSGEKAAPYTGDEIVLGEYGSFTGDTATFGNSTHNGITMAIAEANASGGVLGKKIRVLKEDTASKTDQAATAVLRLINEKNVLAIIGEVASSRSLAAAPLCQKAGVPMISPASTNPKVTQEGNYIFRTCFTDAFQGSTLANYASNDLKAKTVAVFTDVASDYSKGLAAAFEEQFVKNGGKIAIKASYSAGDKDFRAQLTNIKSSNPDVLLVPGYYNDIGQMAVAARSIGFNKPLLGGDGWDSPVLLKTGKDELQGSYFSNHYSPDSKEPRVQAFVAEYKKQFNGETPDAMAALGYDATLIMIDAIKRAGDTDRDKIRDAIATTKGFPGVTGKITVNEERNAVKSITILQIKGNKYEPVKVIAP